MTDDHLLQRVDLNLLKIFGAVYESNQVTAAANRLGLTQSAVSQGLKRLRDLVGDPLFIPSRTGMEPTVRAKELAGPILSSMRTVEQALRRSKEFEAAYAERLFRIGMLDYAIMILAPHLATTLTASAPNIRVEISHVPLGQVVDFLRADQMDLVIGPFSHIYADLDGHSLFAEDLVLAFRSGHPALSKRLTKTGLSKLSYVDVPFDLSGKVGLDDLLTTHGMVRKIVITVPMFAGACHVVGASDVVAIMPRNVVLAHQTTCDLVIQNLPFEMPKLQIHALVHRRNAGDSGIQWLLEALAKGAELF